jgi:hypothetical protein
MPVVDEAALPASLLERFAAGDDYLDVERALAFIGPVTTATGGIHAEDVQERAR